MAKYEPDKDKILWEYEYADIPEDSYVVVRVRAYAGGTAKVEIARVMGDGSFRKLGRLSAKEAGDLRPQLAEAEQFVMNWNKDL